MDSPHTAGNQLVIRFAVQQPYNYNSLPCFLPSCKSCFIAFKPWSHEKKKGENQDQFYENPPTGLVQTLISASFSIIGGYPFFALPHWYKRWKKQIHLWDILMILFVGHMILIYIYIYTQYEWIYYRQGFLWFWQPWIIITSHPYVHRFLAMRDTCNKVWSWLICNYRRKFRSLTSDNMDSWKSRAEQQSQKMKKQRREVESEERRYNCAKVSRKKIHRREMLGKSRNAVFFNDLCVGWVEK